MRGAADEYLMTFTAEAGEALSFDLIGTWVVGVDWEEWSGVVYVRGTRRAGGGKQKAVNVCT